MIYIGVDVGVISGAYAAVNHNGEFVACGDITSIDGRIDARDFYSQLKSCISSFDTGIIAVEDVHSMPKQGIASTSKFMRAAGAIEATAALTRYPLVLVSPQKWKKHHDLIGKDKNASLDMARELFPDAELRLKKHHNRAEALMIALWLKESYE